MEKQQSNSKFVSQMESQNKRNKNNIYNFQLQKY